MSTTVVKILFNGSLRRFEAPTYSFDEFHQTISSTLKLNQAVRLAYTDSDEDVVVFDSTEELKEALVHARVNDVLRVQVLPTVAPPTNGLSMPENTKGQTLASSLEETESSVGAQQLSAPPTKLAEEDKKILKAQVKAEKKILKCVNKTAKLDAKLEAKQEKLLAKQAAAVPPASLQQERAALQLKVAELRNAQAVIAAKRQEIKLLADAGEPVATEKAVVATLVESMQALKAAVQAMRADVQAATAAQKRVEKLEHKVSKIEKKAEKTAAKLDQKASALASADACPALSLDAKLEIARAQFAANGLSVVFIKPEEMAALKAGAKGAFQEHRRKLEAANLTVLMPAFCKRLEQLARPDVIRRVVDNKSKNLLVKGKGDVSKSGQLSEQRVAIEAKQAELERVRSELRTMRQAFKQQVGVVGADVAHVSNTPLPTM